MSNFEAFSGLGTGSFETTGDNKKKRKILYVPHGQEDDYIPRPGTSTDLGYFIRAQVDKLATMSRITLYYETQPKIRRESKTGRGTAKRWAYFQAAKRVG